MANTTVTVKVTPAGGDASEQSVEIEATGAPVSAVLEKAGIKYDPTQQIMVDGEPADQRTHVPAGGVVSMTEKVRGS
ncbi:MAG: hypothetical protein WDN10_01060 [bacterium]